jgi:hypothetical protein
MLYIEMILKEENIQMIHMQKHVMIIKIQKIHINMREIYEIDIILLNQTLVQVSKFIVIWILIIEVGLDL